jgi:hypothetical protein
MIKQVLDMQKVLKKMQCFGEPTKAAKIVTYPFHKENLDIFCEFFVSISNISR